MNVFEAITERKSIRSYLPKPVEEEKLKRVLDAAILSPSARNMQQRHISVVRNTELLDEIAQKINALLGKDDENYHVFHHAPVVLVLSSSDEQHWRKEDIGIMTENIALCAVEEGLGTCILGLPYVLFDTDDGKKYFDLLGIPEGYSPVLCLSLGYPTEPLPEAKPRNYDVVSYID